MLNSSITPTESYPVPIPPQITLTVELQDISGTAIAGTIDIFLCGYGNTPPSIPGMATIGETKIALSETTITGVTTKLYGNDVIVPAGTFYCIIIKDSNNQTIAAGNYRLFGSGPVDFSTLIPYDPNFSGPTEFYLSDVLTGTHYRFTIELKQLKITNVGAAGTVIANLVFIAQDTGLHYLLTVNNGTWSISEISNTIPGIALYQLDDAITGSPETLQVSGGNLQVTP